MATTQPLGDYIQYYDTLLYRVRPGDTLPDIFRRYHPSITEKRLTLLSERVVAESPLLTTPDHLRPDQLIALKIPQQYCAVPTPDHHLFTVRTDNHNWLPELERDWDNSAREDRNLIATLLPAFIGMGSTQMSMIDTTFSTNTPLMREMVINYEDYKNGRKTKGQYDYQRRKLVHQLTTNLGPTSLITTGRRTPSEVLRISTHRGVAQPHLLKPKFRRCKEPPVLRSPVAFF